MNQPITMESVEVSTDLSGGVRVCLGGKFAMVMPPDQAIQFAAAIIKAAGCDVNFHNPVLPIIRPPAGLVS